MLPRWAWSAACGWWCYSASRARNAQTLLVQCWRAAPGRASKEWQAGAGRQRLGEGHLSSVKGTPGVHTSPPIRGQHPGTAGTGVREGDCWGLEQLWRPGLSLGTRRQGQGFWSKPSSGGTGEQAWGAQLLPGTPLPPSLSHVHSLCLRPRHPPGSLEFWVQLPASLPQASSSLPSPPTCSFLPASSCLLFSIFLDL